MNYTKRYVISIFILIALVCAAAAQEQGYRPLTGKFIKDTQRYGLGELTIINDNSQKDALIVITDLNQKPLMEVFIRSKETFKISGITDGKYNIYFRVGNSWDRDNSKFLEDEVRYKLDRPLEFETEETWDGTSYSIWMIALEEAVPDANQAMEKILVAEEDFPS